MEINLKMKTSDTCSNKIYGFVHHHLKTGIYRIVFRMLKNLYIFIFRIIRDTRVQRNIKIRSTGLNDLCVIGISIKRTFLKISHPTNDAQQNGVEV